MLSLASALFLTLHYHRLLLNSLGFLGPITLFLILRVHGFAINPLLSFLSLLWACHGPFLLSTSYIAHDLLFLSFQAPLSPFTSSRPICLSHGPMVHYSYRLDLMSFLSICQLLSIRVTGLLLPTWASKMALNTNQCNWRCCYPKLATSLENILPIFMLASMAS